MPTLKPITALLLFSLQFLSPSHLSAQASPSALDLVNKMVQVETTAWKNRQRFLYINDERSNRTNGHLWHEAVVETPDGSLARLLTEDGLPLSPDRQQSEDKRISWLAAHPADFRRKSQKRHDDEALMPELLHQIPVIFTFKTLSTQGDIICIAFEPNPDFHEQTYQDRLVHAMAGTITIHASDMRLIELNAHLTHKVEYGFGLLGIINDSSILTIKRAPVTAASDTSAQWTATALHVQIDGTILLMKSLSHNLDATRQSFHLIPPDLTVSQAAALLRSNTD
jgi:hypothetical protein